jgi:hypothetical protein
VHEQRIARGVPGRVVDLLELVEEEKANAKEAPSGKEQAEAEAAMQELQDGLASAFEVGRQDLRHGHPFGWPGRD